MLRLPYPGFAIACLAAVLSACAQPAPPPPPPPASNKGGPTIVFTLAKPGKLNGLTYRTGDTSPLAFNVVARDPGGVTEMSLAYSRTVAGCTSILDGSTSRTPSRYRPYLADQDRKFAPADSNEVLAASIRGPFFCVDRQGNQTGFPWGQTITVTAIAWDTAGHQNSARLPIKLVDGGR